MFDRLLTHHSKGEKVTAKAHGGPIEIFGVTVAQVDDKVRLQAIDTWMDPLAMFRQIAPNGIINKQPMNHKVAREDALDSDQDSHADSIHGETEEPINDGAQVDTLKDSGSQHVEHTIVEPADGSPITTLEACPFATQPKIEAHASDLTTLEPSVTEYKDPVKTEAVEIGTPHSEYLAPNTESPLPHSMHQASSASTYAGEKSEAPKSAKALADDNNEVSTIKPGIMKEETLAVAGAEEDPALAGDVKDEVVDNAKVANDPNLEEESQDQNVCSSEGQAAVFTSAEHLAGVAARDEAVDHPTARVIEIAVEQHLEESADHVHPHPKGVEDKVEPDKGEAVVAAAESGKARETQQEMSQVSTEEQSLLMNQE